MMREIDRIGGGATAAASALCVAGYLVGGETAVVGVVLAVVAALTWQVAAASRPRPPRGMGRRSAVVVGHQRDADVVHDEGGQGQRVEDLVEAEPPR